MSRFYCNTIDIMPAHHLRRCAVSIPQHLIRINEYMPWTRLASTGLIQVEQNEMDEKGQTLYDIKIKCKMCDVTLLPPNPCVLQLTKTNGERMIVGWWNKPYPVVTTQKNYSSRADSSAGCFLIASLKSIVPLLSVSTQ